MSPFFDELEAQLRSAAQATAGGHDAPRIQRRWRARLPIRGDAAAVLAAVAVVVVVVGVALALLGHGRHQASTPPASPPPGGGLAALIAKTPQRQLRREFAYIQSATAGVLRSRACQVEQPTSVLFIQGSPSRALLSVLGVLRRPATAADRLSSSALFGTQDYVYARYVRRAFSAGGVSYYIFATRFNRAASVPSNHCFALQVSALAHYLPNIPAALRAPTRALQSGLMAYDLGLIARGPRDAICLVEFSRKAGGESGSGCGTTSVEIKAGMTPEDDNGTFVGIVPDGVASVTLAFPAAHGRPAHSVTAQVRGNVYAVYVPIAAPPPSEPTVIWRSAVGHVLKTTSSPTQQSIRAACRQQPVTCALIKDGGLTGSSSSSSSSTTVKQSTTPQSP